jgi:spore coat protein U-like protein
MPSLVSPCVHRRQESQDRTDSITMKTINPGRLFVLLCLVAAWAGLEGARTPASAAPPPVCSVGGGTFTFGQVDVLSSNSSSPNIAVSIRCDRALGPSIHFCIGKTTLKMKNYPTATATLSYDVAPVNTLVNLSPGSDENRGQAPIGATISDNQQNVPPGDYSNKFMETILVVTYSTTDCVNAPMSPSLQLLVSGKATVQPSCKLVTSNLDFGTTRDLTSAIAAQSQINVQCTNGTGYTVALNGGLTGAADPAQRKMTFNANTITYGLYQNSSHSIPWGSTIGTNVVSGTGSSISQPISVFGYVPAIQSIPAPGNYSDTVVVSVAY